MICNLLLSYTVIISVRNFYNQSLCRKNKNLSHQMFLNKKNLYKKN